MINPKQVGTITEMKVIVKLLELGQVSIPLGNNARYDCILDLNGKLIRIQIKTAKQVENDRFKVPLANKPGGKGKRKQYTKENTDYIGTIIEDEVYLIDPDFGRSYITLSKFYPQNGLKQTVNLLSDFHYLKVLNITFSTNP